MAEFDIGQQCSMVDCKQLDFLPVACDLCGLIYCKQHASYDAHTCSVWHQSCARSSSDNSKSLCWYSCSYTDCTVRDLIEIQCPFCHKNYCLAHRHSSDHLCASDPSMVVHHLPKTMEHVDRILAAASQHKGKTTTEHSSVKQFTNPKSVATAAKIALIKLKQKAVGDASIADADRVFFNVIFPHASNKKSQPMFFNHHWCVGKIIDKIASVTGLTFTNSSNQSQVLSMFEGNTGLLCPVNCRIQDIIDSPSQLLFNGGSVIIEYADQSIRKISAGLYTVK